MNKELKKVLAFLESEVECLEETYMKNIDNEDTIRGECFFRLGFKNHVLWHVYFNLHEFKDNPKIFTNVNSGRLKFFDNAVKELFDKFVNDKGTTFFKLKIMLNDFIVKKEEGTLK